MDHNSFSGPSNPLSEKLFISIAIKPSNTLELFVELIHSIQLIQLNREVVITLHSEESNKL